MTDKEMIAAIRNELAEAIPDNDWPEGAKVWVGRCDDLIARLDISEEARRKAEAQRDRLREALTYMDAQFPLEDYGVAACNAARAALAEVEAERYG